jgi:hypothetical protein
LGHSTAGKVAHPDFPGLAQPRRDALLIVSDKPADAENEMLWTLPLRAMMIACVLASTAMSAGAQVPRDGSHDFDFARGAWHTHATQVLDPFDGGTHTVTLDGTKTAQPMWNGRAWLEEIEADGPNGHWEGATLFVYNAKAGQWSQTYIDSDSGEVEAPTIGAFKDGRGEFYGTSVHKGRTVLVRGLWSDITTNSHRYEIDYSRDGGQTWVAAFKAYLTRIK